MYRSLGMDLPACAQFLHVSARTVHNWESGKHDIPYSAYRLMRLLNFMELPGKAWQGWCFAGGKLISPECRSFEGRDSSWWGLLILRARLTDRKHIGPALIEGQPTAAPGVGQLCTKVKKASASNDVTREAA